MSDRFSDRDATREALSALADGEAPSQDVARACAAWRDQPEAKAAWHDYQMIGDVMRSEDLAQASASEAFLSKFREKLAQEPVVLAPVAAAQTASAQQLASAGTQASAVVRTLRRRAWAGPVSVAAGFVMVVGALMSSQILPGGAGEQADGVSVAQSGGNLMAYPGASANSYMPAQWTGGAVAESGHAPGLSIGSGASFNRPGEVVMVRDPLLDQALAVEHGAQRADATFADQGALIRTAVFGGR